MTENKTGNILFNPKGVALLVTLALVAVLAASALEIGRRVYHAADLTVNYQEMLRADQMALSGIHLAMAVLEEDAATSESDSLQEVWSDPDKLALAVRDLGFTDGDISLSIVDELGKIQVNALIDRFPGNAFNDDQMAVWERLLELVISSDKSADVREPAAIINCIKDWLDSEDDDTITGISGAEASYYLSLDPPVSCRNGPVDMVDELRLVKGVTEDLLSINAMAEELAQTGGITEQPLLDDIFTVFGMEEDTEEKGRYTFPGLININTANVMVLSAMLPPGLEDQAQELADYRVQKEEDGGIFVNSLDKGWYERVIELSETEKETFERLVRYSSSIFRVDCEATLGATTRMLHAVVQRVKDTETNAWTCKLIRCTKG